MTEIAYVYVDEHAISSSLYCPICLDILQEPHTHIPCDSAFCRSCLLQLAEPLCPICRWTWNRNLPLEYNNYLPKAGRLIRNMLDDLRVECIYCHTIRRRGQFEHECQPMTNNNNSLVLKTFPTNERFRYENFSRWIFIFISILWFFLVYYNRENLFQPAAICPTRRIRDVATDLDNFFFEKLFQILTKIFSFSMLTLTINSTIWCYIKCYGEYYVAKTTSRTAENVFETLIIINLIICSIYR